MVWRCFSIRKPHLRVYWYIPRNFGGVLPGIGPALAIGLLLPITLTVQPTQALIMFAAIYYGAMYGGSTTSILLNTPVRAVQ